MNLKVHSTKKKKIMVACVIVLFLLQGFTAVQPVNVSNDSSPENKSSERTASADKRQLSDPKQGSKQNSNEQNIVRSNQGDTSNTRNTSNTSYGDTTTPTSTRLSTNTVQESDTPELDNTSPDPNINYQGESVKMEYGSVNSTYNGYQSFTDEAIVEDDFFVINDMVMGEPVDFSYTDDGEYLYVATRDNAYAFKTDRYFMHSQNGYSFAHQFDTSTLGGDIVGIRVDDINDRIIIGSSQGDIISYNADWTIKNDFQDFLPAMNHFGLDDTNQYVVIGTDSSGIERWEIDYAGAVMTFVDSHNPSYGKIYRVVATSDRVAFISDNYNAIYDYSWTELVSDPSSTNPESDSVDVFDDTFYFPVDIYDYDGTVILDRNGDNPSNLEGVMFRYTDFGILYMDRSSLPSTLTLQNYHDGALPDGIRSVDMSERKDAEFHDKRTLFNFKTGDLIKREYDTAFDTWDITSDVTYVDSSPSVKILTDNTYVYILQEDDGIRRFAHDLTGETLFIDTSSLGTMLSFSIDTSGSFWILSGGGDVHEYNSAGSLQNTYSISSGKMPEEIVSCGDNLCVLSQDSNELFIEKRSTSWSLLDSFYTGKGKVLRDNEPILTAPSVNFATDMQYYEGKLYVSDDMRVYRYDIDGFDYEGTVLGDLMGKPYSFELAFPWMIINDEIRIHQTVEDRSTVNDVYIEEIITTGSIDYLDTEDIGRTLKVGDIAYDGTYFYIVDPHMNRVTKFGSDGLSIESWGSWGDPDTDSVPEFKYPTGITYLSGYLYVADSGNERIVKLDMSGNFVAELVDSSDFTYPYSIISNDAGNFEVLGIEKKRIHEYTGEVIGTGTNMDTNSVNSLLLTNIFNYFPHKLDTYDGNYFVTLFETSAQKHDSGGAQLTTFSQYYDVMTSVNGIFFTDEVQGEVDVYDLSTNSFKYSMDAYDDDMKLFIQLGSEFISGVHKYRTITDISTIVSSSANGDNDGDYFTVEMLSSEEIIYASFSLEYSMRVVENIDGLGLTYDYSGSGGGSSFSITDQSLFIDLLDGSTYATGELVMKQKVTYSKAGVKVFISAFDNQAFAVKSTSQTTSSYKRAKALTVKMDYIYSSTVSVENHVRSDYYYSDSNSDIIVSEVSFEIYDYNIPIRVYAPMHWNLTSVNPSSDYYWNNAGNYWEFDDTIPTNYELIFIHGSGWGVDARQKQILAISDVSSDYIQSPSFESGSNEDWYDQSNRFDDISTNTSIVNDGSFSMRLQGSSTTSTSPYVINQDNAVPEGEYYVSFSYYLEEYTSGTFSFYYADTDMSFQSIEVSSYSTDKWNQFFSFIHVAGTWSIDNHNLKFQMTSLSGDLVLFIDNFQIFQANGQVENTGYSKTEFSSQFISWDGYQNPVVPNHEVNWELRDRTADTSIISKTVFTDSNGIASYVFKGSLESKEYEQRWYSKDSRYNQKSILDTSFWEITDDSSHSKLIQDQSFYTDATDDGDNRISVEYDPNFNLELNTLDELVFRLKTNETGSISRLYFRDSGDIILNGYDPENIASSNTYQTEIFNLNEPDLFGDEVTGTIDNILIYFELDHVKINIEELYFINYQTSYFTPLPASANTYSYERNGIQNNLKNYWDFSEGASEDKWVGGVSQDGYWNRTTTSSIHAIDYKNSDIDFNYYNELVVRWKDVTGDGYITVEWYDGSTWVTASSEQNDQTFEISKFTAPSNIDGFKFLFMNGSMSNPITLYIDYVYLTSSWDQGYGFEFNEPNEFDETTGWNMYDTEYGGARENIEISNGLAYIQSTSNYGGLRINFDETQTISSTNVIEIYGKHISGSSIRFAFRNQGTAILYFNSEDFADDSFSKIILSYTNEKEYDQFIMWSGGTGSSEHYIDYVRLIETSQSPDLEVDSSTGLSYFDTDDNSTEYFQTFVNGSSYGTFSENELFYLPYQTDTSYSFTYTQIFSDDSRKTHVQMPTTMYEYEYTVVDQFFVSIESHSVNDDTISTFATASYDYTYTVYENGTNLATGSGSKDGTTIVTDRATDAGYYEYGIKFVNSKNSSQVRWFNTSYSVARQPPSTTAPSLTDDWYEGETVTITVDGSKKHIRSYYQYISEFKRKHILWVTFDHGVDSMTVHFPTSWEFGTMNIEGYHSPDSTSNNDYVYTDPYADTDYIWTMFSGAGYGGVDSYKRQKQILAISDVTSDYIQSGGFESGSNDDWINHASNTYDDVSINTSIVFDGSFSLRLEDTTSSADYFYLQNDKVPDGEYYVSFSYYVESGSDFVLLWSDSPSTFDKVTLDTSLKNRWITVFISTHKIDGAIGGGIAMDWFFRSDAVSTIFIDNFQLWKANGQAETQGYSKTKFSSQFISWDGYQNPVVPNHEVNWELRDRTADTSIIEKTLYTDSSGIVSYMFKGSLELKEYEQRWWSYENWFGTPWTVSDWTDISNWNDYHSYNVDTDGKTITITTNGLSDADYEPNYDLSNTDYYYLRYEINDTLSVALQFRDASSNRHFLVEDTLTANTVYEIKGDYSDSTIDSGFDYSNITELRLEYDTPPKTEIIYDFHVIQAQKSYFTPLPSNSHSFSYEKSGIQNDIKNYWDFSEGTTEDWGYYIGDSTSSDVEKGALNVTITNNSTGSSRWRVSTDINADIYNYVVIRMKSSISSGYHFDIGYSSGVFPGIHSGNSLSDEYQLFAIEIAHSTWEGLISNFELRWNTILGDGTEQFLIDFVYFTDTWDQGYAWEFEETRYTEGWTNGAMGSTLTVSDGVMELYSPTSFDGMLYAGDYDGEWNDYSEIDTIQIRIKSPDLSIITYKLRDISGSTVRESAISISATYSVYEISVSSYNTFQEIEFTNNLAGAGYYYIDFIRLVETSSQPDLQVDSSTGLTYFDNQNNSTEYYQTFVNGSNYGTFSENELFYLPYQTDTSYSFTYTQIFSDDSRKTHVQIPTTMYEYEYTVVDQFFVSIKSHSVNDDTISTFATASYDYTYTVYENGTNLATGSGSKDGTTIVTDRATDAGYYEYGIKFVNSKNNSQIRWFNTSYSVARQPPSTTAPSFTGDNPWYEGETVTITVDGIKHHIRSYYQYISEFKKKHILWVTFDYGVDSMTVHFPSSWELDNLNIEDYHSPDSTSNNDYVYTDPYADTDYIWTMFSGAGYGGVDSYKRQKQILAISDVSSDYLQNGGFESGSTDGFRKTVQGNGFNSFDVNTSIVNDGSFSLKVSDIDNSDYNSFTLSDNLPAGEYYLSYNYFIEEFAGSDLQLRWNGGNIGFESHSLDTSITNRWQRDFIFIHNYGSDSFGGDTVSLAFEFRLAEAVVFFDNFQLMQANGRYVSTGYSKGYIEHQFVTPDLIPVPNVEVQQSISKRTTQELIKEQTSYTDQNGVAKMPLNVNLNSEEYVITGYTYSSWNGDYALNEKNNPWNFKDTKASFSGYGSSSVTTSDDNLINEFSSVGGLVKSSVSIDTSIYHYLIIDFKQNQSSYTSETFQDHGTATVYADLRFDHDFSSNTRYIAVYDLSDDDDWTGTIYDLLFRIDPNANTKINWFSIRIVNEGFYQRSYFTPLPAGSHSYSYEHNGLKNDIKNYWDFSEDTTENWVKTYGTEVSNTDGSLNVTTSISGQYKRTEISSINIDPSIYGEIVIRLSPSSSITNIRISYYTSSWNYGSYQSVTPNQFNLISRNISTANSNINALAIYYHNGTGEYSSIGDQLQVDYVIPVSSWDQGYAWEFEEYENEIDEVNGWTENGEGNVNTQVDNGIITIDHVTGDYKGIQTDLEKSLTANNYRLRLVAKSPDMNSYTVTTYNDGSFTFREVISLSNEYVLYDFVIDQDFDKIYIWNSNLGEYGDIHIKYVRLIDVSSQIPDINVDSSTGLTYFANDNNSTEYYQTWINGSFYGVVTEGEKFYVPNKEYTPYSLTYTVVWDGESSGAFLPTTIREKVYTNEPVNVLLSSSHSVQINGDTGYFYTNIETTWGNQSYIVYDNGTALGTKIAEGSGIWTFNADYGFHNVTVRIYNGAQVWRELYTSTTIAPPDDNPLQLLDHSITVDLDSETITVFVETNFGNSSVQVYDNGEILGRPVIEGISFWEFNATQGVHNITVYVVHEEREYAIVYGDDPWDFDEGDKEGVTITGDGASASVSSGELAVDLNSTSTRIDFPISGVNASVWDIFSFDIRAFTSGYNLSLYSDSGLITPITTSIPTDMVSYIVDMSEFGNWTGTEEEIYLVAHKHNGDAFSSLDYLWLDNVALLDETDPDESLRSFGTIVTVPVEYGEVYTSFVSPIGVGFSDDVATLYVNGTRQPTGVPLQYPVGSYLVVEAKDFYGEVVGAEAVTVSRTTFVDITVELYRQEVYNEGEVAVTLQIQRADGLGGIYNLTIEEGGTTSFLIFRQKYNLSIVPFIEEEIKDIGSELYEYEYQTREEENKDLGLKGITVSSLSKAKPLVGGAVGQDVQEAVDKGQFNFKVFMSVILAPLISILLLGVMWYLASIGKLAVTKVVYSTSSMFGKPFNPDTAVKNIGKEDTIERDIKSLPDEKQKEVRRILYDDDRESESRENGENGNGQEKVRGYRPKPKIRLR